MKKAYKEIRKKLKNEFIKPQGRDYEIKSSVGLWLTQCGITVDTKHLTIICTIFGSVPYPYQEQDRQVILKYIKNNKYKDFKHYVKK